MTQTHQLPPVPYGAPAEAANFTNLRIGHSHVWGDGANATRLAHLNARLEQLDGLILTTFTVSATYSSGWDGDYETSVEQRAIVWDAAAGEAKLMTLMVWNGQSHLNPHMKSPFVPNAAEAVQKAYAEWYAKTYLPKAADESATKQVMRDESKAQESLNRLTGEIRRGDMVMVVAGRKYAHGLVGKAFWSGQDNYGNLKYGVALSDRKDPVTGKNADVMWIAASNIEKLPQGVEAEEAERLKARVEETKSAGYKARLTSEFIAQYAETGSDTGSFHWHPMDFALPSNA